MTYHFVLAVKGADCISGAGARAVLPDSRSVRGIDVRETLGLFVLFPPLGHLLWVIVDSVSGLGSWQPLPYVAVLLLEREAAGALSYAAFSSASRTPPHLFPFSWVLEAFGINRYKCHPHVDDVGMIH